MTREIQTFRLASQPRRTWLLALGLALTPLFSAQGWAETYDLQSVDFATAGDQTNIILHTGSIVPVQKVLVSENKLILDIDQVNTDETVHTNFSGASNISHVIMQPLNEHKIRMIIRGDDLGAPSVAFYNAGSGSYSNVNPEFDANRISRETQAALHTLQESSMQPATLQATGTPHATPAEQSAIDTTKPLQEEEPIAFGGFVDTMGKNTATQPAPTMGKLTPGTLINPVPEGAPLPLQPGSATMPTHFFDQLTAGKHNGMIPYALLTLMVLGIGGFVCHKILRMKQGAADLEELIDEQAHGKRVSFREMADAYRNKHEAKPTDRASTPKAANRKPSAEDVIGLRSLNHIDETPEARMDSRSIPQSPVGGGATRPAPKAAANSLEQMIAAIQAANAQQNKPVNLPAPKKQAVNQYMQNQQAKAQPKNRLAADELMIKEQKRAQAVQQELLQQAQRNAAAQQQPAKAPGTNPVNRAAAAQKQAKVPSFNSVPTGNVTNPATRPAAKPAQPSAAASQGPLPGNPEVLNFLRNVAELMEKDGKGEIAKSIHKNLNPRNAGLAQ